MPDDAVGPRRTHALSMDEQDALVGAVRETVHRRIIDLIERRGGAEPLLRPCPSCGERVILLDEPATFVFDRGARAEICSACGAQRAVTAMYHPQIDLGGEGGG